ncbi:MAG: 5'-nucleotidase C-terminal domain-containing protein [Rhodoferax sp.]|nr:5'-nucleotidase C-terminal domain-containing protein [Rhodoferax sp.]
MKLQYSFPKLGALAACLALPTLLLAAPGPAPITLSLIAMNDFHGNILPPVGSALVPDPTNPAGSRVTLGGAAYLSTLVKSLKAQNPQRTVVVAAGDMIGASQLTSGLFHDEPTVEVLGKIGLDISSVGNHEFDRGRAELVRIQKGGCYPRAADGSVGKIGVDTCMQQGRYPGAKFQYLAANVVDTASGKTLFPAYSIRNLGGVKVGFIGMTLKDTPSVVTPAGVAGLRFDDEVETVRKLVPEMRAKGATVFVVLIHQGGTTQAKTVMDKSCPGFQGEITDLADRMDPAIDVVVSGHTHQEYVCFRPNGRLITQTGFYGRLVTKIDITVDGKTKKVIAKNANNHPVLNDVGVKGADGKLLPVPANYKVLAKDPAIERVIKRYGDLTAPITEVVVGRLAVPLDRKLNAAGESSLGNLLADVFLVASSDASYGDKPAQIAFTNRGGIRSDLTDSLTVTFGNLFNVLPFNNNMVTMDLTGRQLLRLLEQQWESPQPLGSSRNLSVSSGFSYAWDASKPAGAAPGQGQRVVPGSVMLNGAPIEMDTTYRVTVNNFIASGGDNFTLLTEGRNVQAGEIDLVAAKLYFRLKGVVPAPSMGRITRIN